MSRILFATLLVLFCAQSGRAQTVTMDDYLSDVMERHPFFQKERMQTDIEKAQRDRFLGNEDWRLQATPLLNYRELVASGAFVPDRVYALGLDATADRLFWGSGGRLSLGWESGFSDQQLPDIVGPGATGPMNISLGPSKFYQHRISATYAYPLLQNRGGTLDRLEYELSDYNVDLAAVQSLENQEAFLLDVGVRFLNWAVIVEEHRIGEERLRFSEEQLETITRRRDAYLVDEVDVLRSKNALQVAKQNVVRAESRFIAKRAELAVIVQDESMYELFPDFDIYRVDSLPTIEEAVRKIEHQRIVKALRVRVDQLRHQEKGFEETAKPQLFLNLVGALQDGDPDFGDSFSFDKPEIGIALDFRYPLGNRTAKSDVAKTTLEIKQFEKQIESVALDVEAETRRILIQIDELVKIMALNREQIETARAKTEAEIDRYEQGRGELTFVIQSRDDEYVAELFYVLNAATYHQLVLTYRALSDELLPQ